jgi:hypothetical protein
METQEYIVRMQLDPFWDDEFKQLAYEVESFNNPIDTERWLTAGYGPKFTGAMCDMRKSQPSWNQRFIDHFDMLGWKDIGTSYYRMDTGTVLPVHQDTYKRYIELFNLQGREHTIRRAIVFLERWASGHYLEIDNRPLLGWYRGDTVVWNYDTPHMAANLGLTPRYTLQITGHI